MRTIKGIVVHTTATPYGRHVTVADINAWHKKRGWSGIGYHLVVYLDGTIHRGRPDTQVGAHVFGWNADTLGIVYVGGVDADGKYADTRTKDQKRALVTGINTWVRKYPTIEYICGHRDLSPDLDGDGIIEPYEWIKECPCFNAIPTYRHLLPGAPGPVRPAPKVGFCGWVAGTKGTTSVIGR
jgi:hypothetical protein